MTVTMKKKKDKHLLNNFETNTGFVKGILRLSGSKNY